jgi:hypothetical protein
MPPGLVFAQHEAGAYFARGRPAKALCESSSQGHVRCFVAFKATAFKLQSYSESNRGSRTLISKFGSAALILLGMVFGPSRAPAFDTETAIDELGQYLREDIQRQRARAQREDEESQRGGPDLSALGRAVDAPPARRARKSRRSIQCTTINLGDGDLATTCD